MWVIKYKLKNSFDVPQIYQCLKYRYYESARSNMLTLKEKYPDYQFWITGA